MEELTYSILPQEEWPKLQEFFKGEKGFVPPANLGVAAVGKDSQGIIRTAVILQLVSYLGPLKSEREYQNSVDYKKLKAPLDELFKSGKRAGLIINGFIALPQNEHVAKIAEEAGMERLDCPVLVETFGGGDLSVS